MVHLDEIWAAQHEKHEAKVEYIYNLVAKFLPDFSSEQIDHLLLCFQVNITFSCFYTKFEKLGAFERKSPLN